MTAWRFGVAAFAWCVLVAVGLAFVPAIGSTSCTASSDAPQSVCTSTSHSLLDSEGPSVLGVLAIPVVATGLPLVFRRRPVAIAGAAVLSALTVLGILTIGLFFVPAVGLAWCAVATAPPRPRTHPPRPAAT